MCYATYYTQKEEMKSHIYKGGRCDIKLLKEDKDNVADLIGDTYLVGNEDNKRRE